MVEEDGLAVVLSEFAHTLVTEFSIEGILDHLVRRIVDILPIDAAGVSLISPTTAPYLVAGSDESAVRYEHLQTELGEGPCLAAYDTDGPVSVPDLREDERFPRFAERALMEGLAAVFTFPLRSNDRRLGALDLYRTSPGPLDEHDLATAQTLADVATAYLLNAEARTAKVDFVAVVSHELRTPITTIAGAVELLQGHAGGTLSASQESFVASLDRASTRLRALADDLLAVSSLDGSGSQHPRVELDLSEILRGADRTLGPLIDARRLSVTFEVPEAPVLVFGNAEDLEAMVVNLMTNAVKFTEDGGWVSLAMSVADGTARMVISDNGLGIPIDEQTHLFTRYFRSSTARARGIQGTGLGLMIVDATVRNHGGSISVESEPSKGSVFTVTLPVIDSLSMD